MLLEQDFYSYIFILSSNCNAYFLNLTRDRKNLKRCKKQKNVQPTFSHCRYDNHNKKSVKPQFLDQTKNPYTFCSAGFQTNKNWQRRK